MKLKPPYIPDSKASLAQEISKMAQTGSSISGEIERMKAAYRTGKKTVLPANYKYLNWDKDF